MAFSMQGLSCLHENSSRTALSHFAVLNALQHNCGMHCRPAIDAYRRQLLYRHAQSISGCARRRKVVQALDKAQCTRHTRTVCHAQAIAAEPTVTGQPQQEATPIPGSKHSLGQSSAYPFGQLEAKWQSYWSKHKTFRTPGIEELDKSKPKFYALDMFPYPSGSGLHVGHPEGYTATDIMARYKRMTGHNVLHPMGWDAFGLPAETYAIQTGTHPADTTSKNIDRFRQQLQALGFSYDWDREIATTDPEFYKWTQWIFIQLFNKGLAYQAEVPVNWCPALGTVLANEEIIDGKSERGDHPVERMPMKQWMLRITQYADRLLEDLDDVDWSDSIKDMQRNWIGRSQGAQVSFRVQAGEGATVPSDAELEVYTTRPDTLFGVTYMVVAPEHPLLSQITTPDQQAEVDAYVQRAGGMSDLERTELQKSKTGMFTGSYAVNPVNQEAVPVWVADYVLGSYGSGAIMAVPAHDFRDYEFAQEFGLPVRQVVQSPSSDQELPYTGEGVAMNSCSESGEVHLDGLPQQEAQQHMLAWLQQTGRGRQQVNYKLRDWLFARQRYWGEPFPIIFPEGSQEAKAVQEDELPLTLPSTQDFKPSGRPESPLAKITDWVQTTDPATGGPARRETCTMPQWAGSCWYYLRFIDPTNSQRMLDAEAEKYWMPVDLYVGGAEHAVLHLLYARFWHKVLYDLGMVSHKEPFQQLVSQGMILGELEYVAMQQSDGSYSQDGQGQGTPVRLDPAEVEKKGDRLVWSKHPDAQVTAQKHKMSKSRGNVVNPDDVVYRYGADSLRLYEMFLGPLQDTKVWSTNNIEGVHRFLARVYRLITEQPVSASAPSQPQLRLLHATIKKVLVAQMQLAV
ncbi:TPA: hypothetical protein ACH3X3_014684 [Trebouxia sp. C0006]